MGGTWETKKSTILNECAKYCCWMLKCRVWVELIALISSHTIMIGVKQLCRKHGTLTNCSLALGSEHAYFKALVGWLVALLVAVVGIHKTQNKLHTQNLESKVLRHHHRAGSCTLRDQHPPQVQHPFETCYDFSCGWTQLKLWRFSNFSLQKPPTSPSWLDTTYVKWVGIIGK